MLNLKIWLNWTYNFSLSGGCSENAQVYFKNEVTGHRISAAYIGQLWNNVHPIIEIFLNFTPNYFRKIYQSLPKHFDTEKDQILSMNNDQLINTKS